MLDCPICGKETNTLVIPLEGKLSCRLCAGERRNVYNVNLGQTIDTYIRKDGSKGRITVGKDWEISNRRISSEDRRVVINSVTGKETQY